jgi:hypothetical protein
VCPRDRDLRIFWIAFTLPCAFGQGTSIFDRGVASLENYLTMSGQTAANFQPQSQAERNETYLKSLINPFSAFKAGVSAGIDQWHDKPAEWGEGWDAYGKRAANIAGQYTIQKTTTWALASALHEDNRYFGSGKHGFWPRTAYALQSSVLARHDDGSRSVSISGIGGFAAGAFVARAWLPPSQSSASDGAVSFGISMGGNAATCVVKEFLPDLFRKFRKDQTPAH